MRQIKFRALKDDISNCNWVYGNLFYYRSEAIIQEDNNRWVFTSCLKGTEGQFTGLTDKNGNEIYEGDILGTGHLEFKCKVTFEDGCFQLKTNQEQGNSHLSQGRASRLDIIGNIHEHAHLLNN